MKKILPSSQISVNAIVKNAGIMVVAALLLVCNHVYARPMLTDTPYFYYKTPDIFFTGKPITALTPTATNVATPPYSASVTLTLSGITAPKAVGIDDSGNLYVLDTIKEKVYKIAAGTTTPVAWSAGFTKGTAMAVDYQGNSFIADASDNKVIMKPYSGGTPVAFYTGSKIQGVTNQGPYSNSIYILDANTIGIVDWANSYVTGVQVSGSGFVSATAIAVSQTTGFLYVTDPGSNGVYKISIASPYTQTLIYTDTNYPNSIAVDQNGNVFVTEKNTNNVVMIPVAGTPLVIANGFNKPVGLFIYPSTITPVYLCDSGNGAVDQLNRTGGYYIPALPAGLTFNVTTGAISGTPTTVLPPTDYNITAYNGTVSSSSRVNLRVGTVPLPTISYTSPPTYTAGLAITPLAPSSSGVTTFGYSAPVVVPSSIGGLYDAAGNQYGINGNYIVEYPVNGTPGHNVYTGVITNGTNLAIDSAHNFYSAGPATAGGAIIVVKYPAGGGAPVIINSGSFAQPTFIAADAAGNVYILDVTNTSLSKIAAGTSTPVLMSGFYTPDGLVIDPTGKFVYVSDPGIKATRDGGGTPGRGIVKISTTAPYTVTSLYGKSTYESYSLTIDAGGNVYFTNGAVPKLLQMVPSGAGSATTLLTGSYYTLVNADPKGNLFLSMPGFGIPGELSYRTGGYYLGTPLPQGLQFNVNTGTISGTPAASSSAKKYTVYAYDGSGGTAATFTIGVNPANPANDTLAMLNVSSGTLTPAFAPATFSYRDTVSVDTLNLTPVAVNPAATIRVNGVVLPHSSADKVGLTLGNNTVTVSVTSPDSSAVANYNLVINRFIASTNDSLAALVVNKGILSPAFSSSITAYADTVLAATANLVVTPTAGDATAVIKVNGVVVPSGAASANIPLVIDSINTVTVLVTAQSGAQKSYIINVTRPLSSNDSLKNIVLNDNAILSPAFNTDSLIYATSLAYNYTSVTVKPTASNAAASIKVAGVTVHSGMASAPILLPVGTTGIHIAVTAPDGSVMTYIVRVKRNTDTNNLLSNLTLSGGIALSPAFVDTVYTYNASVANSVSSLMFKPTAADTTETILVNGVSVASGAYSQAISFPVGAKTIKMLIHAQSGATNAYYVTVTRAAATGADAINIPYPNPFLQMVNLNVGNTLNKNITVEVHSLSDGSSVYTKQLNNISGVMQLDLSGLKSGLYVLHLSFDGTDKYFKIIKQ